MNPYEIWCDALVTLLHALNYCNGKDARNMIRVAIYELNVWLAGEDYWPGTRADIVLE